LKLQLSTCEAWLWWGGGGHAAGAASLVGWGLLALLCRGAGFSTSKPEALLGIKFPELEFRFWAFSALGRMGLQV